MPTISFSVKLLVPSLAEKNESSHQRHNRRHNNGKVNSLGSLLVMPVKLSNGVADKDTKAAIKLTNKEVSGHPNYLCSAQTGYDHLTH